MDAGKWFVILTWQVEKFGLSEKQIIDRVLTSVRSEPSEEYRRDQPTSWEVDFEGYGWRVTRSRKTAPDGNKRMAFIVDSRRPTVAR